MAKPHPALIEIAAGRPLHSVEDPDRLLQSAIEHRMTGLLWRRFEAGELAVDTDWQRALAIESFRHEARNRNLRTTLQETVKRITSIGLEPATAKGVTAEARWYDRLGDRPTGDIDLFLGPEDLGRIEEVVAELQPDHPLLGHIPQLVNQGVQTFDIRLPNGIWVDLHTDILKWELPSRQLELVWQHTKPFTLTSSSSVRVLDADLSLILSLVNINRDRFRQLISFVDVVRILDREVVDWDFVDYFLRFEGLEVHLYRTLDIVLQTLDLPLPSHPQPSGWRVSLWNFLWRESARLPGDMGKLESRRKFWWIPLTVRGRTWDAVRWLWGRALPPRAAVDFYYPGIRGPYLFRLVLGRIRDRIGWRRKAKERRRGAPDRTPERPAGDS